MVCGRASGDRGARVSSPPRLLDEFAFPARAALVVGRESSGLPDGFLDRCAHVVTVPQYGPVASLNVAVAASLAMYEMMRGRRPVAAIGERSYADGRTPP